MGCFAYRPINWTAMDRDANNFSRRFRRGAQRFGGVGEFCGR
jgi:hypothetical protein